MTTTTYESAVLIRRWQEALENRNPTAVTLQNAAAPDPEDRRAAFNNWEAANLNPELLQYVTSVAIAALAGDRSNTVIKFRNQDRRATIAVNEHGVVWLENATLGDDNDRNIANGLTKRYGDKATANWMQSGGTRMMALTNPPDTTKVELWGGQLRLTMRGRLTPDSAHEVCQQAGTTEAWRRSLARGIGQLAAQLGATEFREEIPPMLMTDTRMPSGAAWMKTLMQNGETMLNKLQITPLGYLYLKIQYEHASYENQGFSLLTGRKKSQRSNEPDSTNSRCGVRHVVRITRRDANGLITNQRLRIGKQVPAKARKWLQETGFFPSRRYFIAPQQSNGAVPPGEVNPPYFHGT